jgi:hypothetical protein
LLGIYHLLSSHGVTGSEKTFTLLKTCARLQELAEQAGKQSPVGKSTLHSLLKLPVKGKKLDLSATTLQALQSLCRFLIINEKSMIDIKTFP